MSPKIVPTVLLVEDSPDDVDFARRALVASGLNLRLVVVERGDDALALLRAPFGSSAVGVQPALVLMDLNLPGTSGREVLSTLKSDPQLRSIPVVILSTSTHRDDAEFCYRTGANSYHSKPVDLARYQQLLAQIVEYWLGAAASWGGHALCEPSGQLG